MAKAALRVELLGASFAIAADEDPAYLQSLLSRYRRAVDEARQTTGLNDPLKLAIVAGIVLCDEHEKSRHGLTGDALEAERMTLDLIARIDEALADR
jgi:cell division protein ZapA (FtsZ GTPase activity inhibitor)